MVSKAVKKAKAVKRTRTPDFKEWPAWSEAKFFSFLRSGLRAKWSRFPSKYAVMAAAKRPSESSNARLKWEFQCAICSKWYPQSEVSVDHIIPCGSLNSFDDLPGFCQRLFVGTDKLQCVCHECHRLKTAEDKKNNNKEKLND